MGVKHDWPIANISVLYDTNILSGINIHSKSDSLETTGHDETHNWIHPWKINLIVKAAD